MSSVSDVYIIFKAKILATTFASLAYMYFFVFDLRCVNIQTDGFWHYSCLEKVNVRCMCFLEKVNVLFFFLSLEITEYQQNELAPATGSCALVLLPGSTLAIE